uniref:Small subunit processome component 20 n=1 Tax=Anthurium amnicola TaxID=1678845 RepID=A0A1D1Z466_9ARAE
MDDTTSDLITKNLVFSICGVHSHAKQKGHSPVNVFWSSLSHYEQGSYVEAFELLGSRNGRNTFLQHITGDVPEVSEMTNPNLQLLLVVPLLRRMGKLALARGDVQMEVLFNCFGMISEQIGPESCREYAIHMMLPIYKVCEGFVGKVVSAEIKELASKARDAVRGVLGVDHFVKAYNEVRKSIEDKRDKRKRSEKLTAVINPVSCEEETKNCSQTPCPQEEENNNDEDGDMEKVMSCRQDGQVFVRD